MPPGKGAPVPRGCVPAFKAALPASRRLSNSILSHLSDFQFPFAKLGEYSAICFNCSGGSSEQIMKRPKSFSKCNICHPDNLLHPAPHPKVDLVNSIIKFNTRNRCKAPKVGTGYGEVREKNLSLNISFLNRGVLHVNKSGDE